MKNDHYIDHLIVWALLLLNLVTVLVYVLKVNEIRTIILINIFCANLLLSFGIYLFYKLVIKRHLAHYDLEDINKFESQNEKLRILKKLIEEDAFEKALHLISDYAMEEYKDLVEDEKIPYPLAVLIGRYRRLCKLEGIYFELTIENKVMVTGEKANHVISLIGNLLDNAIDEVRNCKKDKWVTLRISSPREGEILIKSQNSLKHSVDPEKIFRPGYTTKRSISETKRGFGLSIVAQIVSSYDGQLEVDVNKGEDFTIVLQI